MSTQQPVISVIVAVYNRAATVERCIASVARQTYPHTELIVTDGGSTDGTVDILKANAGRIAYWESRPDRGISHAWNKALEHATGDWICFIGSDDFFWEEDVLERLAPHLSVARPAVRLVYGQVAILSLEGQFLRHIGKPWEETRDEFRRALDTTGIPHSGLLHHRSLFDDHGRFDESLRIAADFDLLLRELKDGAARFVPDVVSVGFQQGGISSTPSSAALSLREQARIRQKHRLPHPGAKHLLKVQLKTVVGGLILRCAGDAGYRTVVDACRRALGRPTVWR